MKHKSKDIKVAVVEAVKSGRKYREVAQLFGVGLATVNRIIKKFNESQTVERKSGSGRPRKSDERQDRLMLRVVKKDPRKTAVDVTKLANEQMGLNISVRTARRRLKLAKLFARRPAKKPLISKKNRLARLAFARRYQHWTKNEWEKILWSDESKFNLFSSDGIRYVRRPPGERYKPIYQIPTVKHGGGNVMIWGQRLI